VTKTIAALLLFASTAYAGIGKGQRAPDFTLPSMKGSRVSLSSLKGKVVLLDFWAHWCEPCKRELPELEKLHKQYSNVVVLTVNIDKQRDNAEKLFKSLGLSLEVLFDPAGSVAGQYEPPKMPSSYVIDKKGIVRYVHEGFDGSGDIARFKQELDELTK
jgi:cytochrome c biogenesis protein CcmG, thiol:disulfide interchange protein DsbE